MPCEILIKAVANPNAKKYQKGEIQDVRDLTVLAVHPWGSAEALPNWVKVRISDATADEIRGYLSDVKDIISWDLQNSNANGRRYRVYIHPKVAEWLGGFKAKIRDYLVSRYAASVHSADLPNGEVTLDIPNTDWTALKADILDKFEDRVVRRLYRFPSADIDALVSVGGWVERTKAQVAAVVVDRLA